jgi:adenosine deaminase
MLLIRSIVRPLSIRSYTNNRRTASHRTLLPGEQILSTSFRVPLSAVILLSLCSSISVSAQAPEQRAIAAFRKASSNPLELRAFLEGMPKGGELHFHLTGAVYAETVLRNATEDNLCVDPVAHRLAPNKGMEGSPQPHALCDKGMIAASDLPMNQQAYDAMVDAWSMRSFVPSAGISGHDHFFSTFLRAGTDRRHLGEWLDEAATRAAAQNEQYLEIQTGTPYPNTSRAVEELGWNPDMSVLRQSLLSHGLRDDIALGRAELDQMEATRTSREHCGTPQATPACSVLTRFLYVVSRGNPPARVFAQAVLAFEIATADQRVVGINFAQPEDGYLSMSEYHRQMEMLNFLHTIYPRVHISLHAGELSFGMVTPDGLKFHVREAVELGHAERIGHGVDVMYETNPHQLLQQMAAKHIMVEINLTSNDVILGVTGKQHPLPLYLAAHVPVAFSTDDEGVSRIDLTHEYLRAVTDFGLEYLDLKRSARTSIEHSFLPGDDLWDHSDDFTRMVPACTAPAAAACEQFRSKSLKAEQEWQLEQRFHVFESSQQ